jgi:hypothetical protein
VILGDMLAIKAGDALDWGWLVQAAFAGASAIAFLVVAWWAIVASRKAESLPEHRNAEHGVVAASGLAVIALANVALTLARATGDQFTRDVAGTIVRLVLVILAVYLFALGPFRRR